MRLASPMMFASLALLSGCSLLHSNIKGGFACAAPRGTCAPSMRIDDAAIHEIGRQDDHGNTLAATSDRQAGGVQSSAGASEARSTAKREWVFVRGARPAIKVVFPEWRDASGQLHPRTAAYAPIDLPPAVPIKPLALDGRRLGAVDSGCLLAIAEMAPEIGTLPAPPPAGEGSAKKSDGAPPAPAAMGGLGTASPLDAIKEQVKQILSTTGHPVSAPLQPKAGNGAAVPAASFPPAGN